MCWATRYTSASRGRILGAVNAGVCNVLYGHWAGRRGVVHEDTWVQSSSIGNTYEWTVDCYSNGETAHAGKNFIVDGVNRGSSLGVKDLSANCLLGVNWLEQSNFEIADVVIWDKSLSNEQMKAVTDRMMQKLNPSRQVPAIVEPVKHELPDYTAMTGTKPWGVWRADDFDVGASKIPEASGNGRDAVVTSGAIAHKNAAKANGATSDFSILGGGVRTTIKFPQNSIPAGSRSVCGLSRYSGAAKSRLITTQSNKNNLLYGHWDGRRGVVHEEGWSSSTSRGTTTDWLAFCFSSDESFPSNLLVNSVPSGTAFAKEALSSPAAFGINTFNSEVSDFEFSELIVWDKALHSDELKAVEDTLMKKINPSHASSPTSAPFAAPEHHKVDYDEITGVEAWGIYMAADFEDGKLLEARRNGRDGIVSGHVDKRISTVGTGGAEGRFEIMKGNHRSKVVFPSGSVPRNARTICTLTRYSGAHKGRIVTGTQPNQCNALYGHHENKRGVVYDGNWINSGNVGSLDHWVATCSSSGMEHIVVDGVSRGNAWAAKSFGYSTCQMSINGYAGEPSDWEFAELAIWDKALTDTQMKLVQDEMLKKVLPNRVSNVPVASHRHIVDYDRISAVLAWGIYRAGDYNNGILKEARGNGRDARSTGDGVIDKKVEKAGNGAEANLEVLDGSEKSILSWPDGSIPTGGHTVCAISRYSGNHRGRILTSSNHLCANALYGHHDGRRGVTYDMAWVDSTPNGGSTDWLVQCYASAVAKPNNVAMINGAGQIFHTGLANGGHHSKTCAMSINGMNGNAEASDFQLVEMALWDQSLSAAKLDSLVLEMQEVLKHRSWPTPNPTQMPTLEPVAKPTNEPISHPTQLPTLEPTGRPQAGPTMEPIAHPTLAPTLEPSHVPTDEPHANPSQAPTNEPVSEPTLEPSREPISDPTSEPVAESTSAPSKEPTFMPVEVVLPAEDVVKEDVLPIQKDEEVPSGNNTPAKLARADCSFTFTKGTSSEEVSTGCILLTVDTVEQMHSGDVTSARMICPQVHSYVKIADLDMQGLTDTLPGDYIEAVLYSETSFKGESTIHTSHYHPPLSWGNDLNDKARSISVEFLWQDKTEDFALVLPDECKK